uniref:Uncharacterized protein n=1 Tax=Tanacetum cinerariifolium TaxID=118510 RepID=A0A6L2KMT5_TANCI|nr:hypothetical protein [Tanacetum cinerariifolium]
MNAIERFLKSINDKLSEDSLAKQSVEKEIKSSDGKMFLSCHNLVQEKLQSRDMCIQSTDNQFVQHPLEYSNGKRPKISISDVLNGEVSFDEKRLSIYHGESSKNEALSEEFDPKEYDKNVHESGDGNKCKKMKLSQDMQLIQKLRNDQKRMKNVFEVMSGSYEQKSNQDQEYAGFDFNNTDNDSLSEMVKTREEKIHLHGLEKVDDLFVQTHVKQNSEYSPSVVPS